jgi:hypothetical protein
LFNYWSFWVPGTFLKSQISRPRNQINPKF